MSDLRVEAVSGTSLDTSTRDQMWKKLEQQMIEDGGRDLQRTHDTYQKEKEDLERSTGEDVTSHPVRSF